MLSGNVFLVRVPDFCQEVLISSNQFSRSVLATISLDYHGRIYGIEKEWQVIADLSKMLFNFYCEKGWQAVPDATSVNVVDAAKARAYRQSFIGIFIIILLPSSFDILFFIMV